MYFSEDRNTGGHLIRKASDRYYQVLQYARLMIYFSRREKKENFNTLCLGVKKKILKEILHFHYLTYFVTP